MPRRECHKMESAFDLWSVCWTGRRWRCCGRSSSSRKPQTPSPPTCKAPLGEGTRAWIRNMLRAVPIRRQ